MRTAERVASLPKLAGSVDVGTGVLRSSGMRIAVFAGDDGRAGGGLTAGSAPWLRRLGGGPPIVCGAERTTDSAGGAVGGGAVGGGAVAGPFAAIGIG